MGNSKLRSHQMAGVAAERCLRGAGVKAEARQGRRPTASLLLTSDLSAFV
jgi:hypothetical protein